MVNLNKPLREYTPIHIRDECVPAANPSNKVEQALRPFAVATQSISYSQLASKDCRQHLASVFREATDSEFEQYNGIWDAIHRTMKHDFYNLAAIIASLAVGIITLAVTIYIVVSSPAVSAGIVAAGASISGLGFIAPCFLALCFTNDLLVYKVLKNASDLFISKFGADTYETYSSIIKGDREIRCRVFRPYHCKDYNAFYEVTNDRHNVFVVYSKACNTVVMVDPNLFN